MRHGRRSEARAVVTGQASAISGDADANAADASYRDEIAKIKNSGSTEAAQILEDGKITEEELVQLGSSYAQCLTSKGITVDTGEARYPGGRSARPTETTRLTSAT